MQPLDLFVSWKNELPQLSILESFFFNNITSNLNSNWNQNILTNWRHGYVCSDNGKLLVTENFCDKISHSICTQIKENGNNDRSLRWKPLIASWLFVCHLKRCPVDSIQSCFDTSLFATILSRFDTHLKLTQYKLKSLFHTKLWDTWQSKIIIEFPHLELAGDTGRFVPLWGSSDFPSNQAGFREEVQRIQQAEKVLRPPHKHDFSPSGMTFFRSIAINYTIRTWKDFHLDICSSSLLLRNDFSLCQIDLKCVSKLTFVCVETTLYQNERKPLKSVPDFIARMMGCTVGLIQHGRWVTRKDVFVTDIYLEC